MSCWKQSRCYQSANPNYKSLKFRPYTYPSKIITIIGIQVGMNTEREVKFLLCIRYLPVNQYSL